MSSDLGRPEKRHTRLRLSAVSARSTDSTASEGASPGPDPPAHNSEKGVDSFRAMAFTVQVVQDQK